MSPISNIRAKMRYTALALSILSVWNCGSDSPSDKVSESVDVNTSSVMLEMNFVETPLIDSLTLDCYGADTLHLVGNPEAPYFDMDLFPSENWVFKAKLYANGALMQTGEISTKLEAGTKVDLQIQMHALAGFVYIEIPLGFGNPAGIASGTLTLNDGSESFTYPMEIAGTTAVFKSEAIALGKEYAIQITLQDKSGTPIYSLEDSFTLSEDSPIPELEIKSLRAKVSLAIELAAAVNMDLDLNLPAIKRSPKAGDVVVSEFLVNPSKNDSMFDFVEFYNGSNDTLNFTNCYIGKSKNQKESAKIDDLILPPRDVLVLGNDTNPNTPSEFKHTENMPTFSKSNTAASTSIILYCNGVTIDSVYYGKNDSTATAIPLNTSTSASKSSQLNVNLYESKNDGASWCLGSPTPGSLNFCEQTN